MRHFVHKRSKEAVRRNATMEKATNAFLETLRGNTSANAGYVNKLYTWGSAAILRGGFLPDPRRGDRCWRGRRIVNTNTEQSLTGVWYTDIVTNIANAVGYWHAGQPTVKLSESGIAREYPCGDDGDEWLEVPSVKTHSQNVYKERSNFLSGEAETLTRYFVVASYMTAQEAAANIAPSGWRMVGSSEWDEKETHLMQHPSSKECILSFQGSAQDRVLDWWDNLRFYDVKFCGLGDNVHGGFRDQLRAILRTNSFKNNILSKLPKCKDVTVVGHSLGGALASLYSYCVNVALSEGMDGWDDHQLVQFSRSTPELLPPI